MSKCCMKVVIMNLYLLSIYIIKYVDNVFDEKDKKCIGICWSKYCSYINYRNMNVKCEE